MTERSCTREVGRSSEQRSWMLSGKRSTRNGPRGPQRNSPSGSERGQAKRLETPQHPRVKKRVAKMPQPRRKKKRRRSTMKRRKRSKPNLQQPLIYLTFLTALDGDLPRLPDPL